MAGVPKTAGMLLFVHKSMLPLMEEMVSRINGSNRVSSEVLSLHMVTPTREEVKKLSRELSQQVELQHLERISKLKGNNSLKDLTADKRLDPVFAHTHKLVVNLETFNPEFKKKYPEPNLTLPAGKVEVGESIRNAAHRELLEETRIRVDPRLITSHIGLFRGGIRMFVVEITDKTNLTFTDQGMLDVGCPRRIWEHYRNIPVSKA